MTMRTGTDANRSRERGKQEAAYLRGTVAQLEAELEQIRIQYETAHVLAVAGAGDASVRAQAIESAAWQAMAERQRRLRYEAEIENNKLRSSLEDQIRVGKVLEKLLHRRQHADVESMLSRRMGTACDARMTAQSRLDDPQTVSDLKANLADQLRDVHKVFAHANFTSEAGPFRHTELRYRDVVGTYVETTKRRILPFDERIISAAVVHHFESQNARAVAGQDFWTRGEIVEYDLTSMIDTVRFRGLAQAKVFLQCVVIQDATFILFAGISDPGESLGGASSFDGLYVRHRGWIRLRAVPQSEDLPDSATVTEYAHYHIATPEVHDVTQDQKRKIGTLTNYVLATLGFQLDDIRESIDNYLLAQAMASPSTRPNSSRKTLMSHWDTKNPMRSHKAGGRPVV